MIVSGDVFITESLYLRDLALFKINNHERVVDLQCHISVLVQNDLRAFRNKV
jgi:hypothetical protein